MNWANTLGGNPSTLDRKDNNGGQGAYFWFQKDKIRCLILLMAGHDTNICGLSPTTFRQVGARQKPSLFCVQCLLNLSVLYRPDISLATMIALETSKGWCWENSQIKWGRPSWQLLSLNSFKDISFMSQISSLNLSVQYFLKFLFTRLLNSSFLRSDCKSDNGWGSFYFLHNSRIPKNHDLHDLFRTVSTYLT